MVRRPKLVDVSTECDLCGTVFHDGDKAICVVQVPDADIDTICMADWHAIMSAADSWLRQMGRTSPAATETLHDALQAMDPQSKH